MPVKLTQLLKIYCATDMLLNRRESSESLRRFTSFLPSINRTISTPGASSTTAASCFPEAMTPDAAVHEEPPLQLQTVASAVQQHVAQVQNPSTDYVRSASLPRLGSRPAPDQVRVLALVLAMIFPPSEC